MLLITVLKGLLESDLQEPGPPSNWVSMPQDRLSFILNTVFINVHHSTINVFKQAECFCCSKVKKLTAVFNPSTNQADPAQLLRFDKDCHIFFLFRIMKNTYNIRCTVFSNNNTTQKKIKHNYLDFCSKQLLKQSQIKQKETTSRNRNQQKPDQPEQNTTKACCQNNQKIKIKPPEKRCYYRTK